MSATCAPSRAASAAAAAPITPAPIIAMSNARISVRHSIISIADCQSSRSRSFTQSRIIKQNIRVPVKAHKKRIFTRAFMAFMDNDLTTAAAAVSYFSMLTLFPTLLLLLTIGNHLLGAQTVGKYIDQVLAFLPGAQTFVRKNLESISNISASVVISCIFVMLWAASWMFTVIEKALNRVWGTYPRAFLHGRVWNMAVMGSDLGAVGRERAVHRIRDRRAGISTKNSVKDRGVVYCAIGLCVAERIHTGEPRRDCIAVHLAIQVVAEHSRAVYGSVDGRSVVGRVVGRREVRIRFSAAVLSLRFIVWLDRRGSSAIVVGIFIERDNAVRRAVHSPAAPRPSLRRIGKRPSPQYGQPARGRWCEGRRMS